MRAGPPNPTTMAIVTASQVGRAGLAGGGSGFAYDESTSAPMRTAIATIALAAKSLGHAASPATKHTVSVPRPAAHHFRNRRVRPEQDEAQAREHGTGRGS